MFLVSAPRLSFPHPQWSCFESLRAASTCSFRPPRAVPEISLTFRDRPPQARPVLPCGALQGPEAVVHHPTRSRSTRCVLVPGGIVTPHGSVDDRSFPGRAGGVGVGSARALHPSVCNGSAIALRLRLLDGALRRPHRKSGLQLGPHAVPHFGGLPMRAGSRTATGCSVKGSRRAWDEMTRALIAR